MKKITYILGFVLMGINATSQDFHLSQYDNVVQYINPAYIGYNIGKNEDYRVSIDHRNQWAMITSKPYRSFLFSYDQKIDEKFSVGGHFMSNNASLNNINTFNVMLAGAYNIIQSPISDHRLKAGLQLGIFHRFIDYDQHTYDNQYSSVSGTFDTAEPSGEVFQQNVFTRFDAGLGMYYQMESDNMFNPFGGFSLRHISFPNEAIALDRFTLPMHWILHAGTGITINKEWSVSPNILFMYQKAAWEFNFGAMGQYNVRDTDYSVMLGLNHRLKDAVIVHAGFKYKKSVIRFSYDINSSYLYSYTNHRGAFEFSIGYVGSFTETARLFKPSFK
ncbi:MAG: PorP/SprF family type IX secretion system membrane protein [Bacteroidia bacterium]